VAEMPERDRGIRLSMEIVRRAGGFIAQFLRAAVIVDARTA